jgi:selenocysteine lyase/cysteine desulfurase
VPRGCAVFYVPFRNQHLIRTSLPTSHSYLYPGEKPDPAAKPQFANLFDFVATLDYSAYLCVPTAIEYRETLGGEEAIRKYTWDVARHGGERVAEILGTYVMDSKSGTMSQCAFSNVRLPLEFKPGYFSPDQASKIMNWINQTAVDEYDTYLQVGYHSGSMWIRLSGQVYLEFRDFEWLGHRLKQLCERLNDNPELVRK